MGRDVSGGSSVSVGGVTIIINQSQHLDSKAEQPTTLGGLMELISELKPPEQKSFMKFMRTALGDLRLTDVDASTVKRINAYVNAIYERRQ